MENEGKQCRDNGEKSKVDGHLVSGSVAAIALFAGVALAVVYLHQLRASTLDALVLDAGAALARHGILRQYLV